jgi:hypothetical protein
MTTAPKLKPAPASRLARATKLDRVKFLEDWALQNPLETIEEARTAIRERFGISLGTKIISDTLRDAKRRWETERRVATEHHRPMTAPTPREPAPEPAPAPPVLNGPVRTLALAMKNHGIRLIEIKPDGSIHAEFMPEPEAS